MAITGYRKTGTVEITLSDSTNHVFPRHSHDEFYLGANLAGREKIWLDGKRSEASIADITVYNPGQVQAATPTPYNWVYYSFYIPPQVLAELTGLPEDDEFRKSVFTAPDIADDIIKTGAYCLDYAHSDDEVLERLAVLLKKVLQRTGCRTKLILFDQDAVLAARIAAQLKDELLEPPSLNDLSAQYGLSAVQLVRIFSASYGLPPFAWLKVEKLKIAKNLLLRGLSLSDIAAGLNFADQSHFTHSFKEMFNITPGQMSRLYKGA
ncbi:AraC family transcriptional regulator [Enterobacter sp.]|uniref:AraC family transcriptional regulator n=1 Tax=Enterobacter sp. TaxID=42895 RepID=UPI00296F76D6|nr:AraC family transcriptional regulator [Enterobacter sp.]